ncbi:hypothetical protein V8F06_001418 [Rhypophila decipiens]
MSKVWPFEILTWIFKFLVNVKGLLVDSQQGVYRLSLTHSKLRSVAERLLYANVVMKWFSDHPPPILALVRSLQRRPELANCVQSIELAASRLYDNLILRDFEPRRFGSWQFGHDGSMEDAPEYFKWQQFPNAQAWKDALRRARQTLLSPTYSSPPSFVASLFGNALYGSHLKRTWEPSFPVLRSVRIDHRRLSKQDNGQMSWKRDNFHDILPYLYLPSVEHLKLTISNARHDSSGNHSGRRCWSILEDDTSESWPMPTKLKSLELSLIREGRLGQILKVAKVANLTSLVWMWCYEPLIRDDEYMTSVIDIDQMAADLSHASRTLEKLTISARTFDMYRRSLTMKGSNLQVMFPPLIALRKLEIPLVFLDLNQEWRPVDIVDLVREWLLGVKPGGPLPKDKSPQAPWKPYPPNLKSVRIVITDSDVHYISKVWFQWILCFRDIGELTGVDVQFTIRVERYD